MTSVLDRPEAPSAMKGVAPASRRADRFVVVQSGARDAYQVALALAEAGRLESLVTDLFWPSDKPWARALAERLPAGLKSMLRQRSERRIPSRLVRLCAAHGMATLLLDRAKAPLTWRRSATRRTDGVLGRTAGRLARERGCSLLSYSYYGYDAFQAYRSAGTLFQLHPHPASMRRLLTEELEAHPDCASSLKQEWELALPEQEFRHLCEEVTMARSFLAASSFTRSTLIENGVAAEAVQVVPYGVDASRFHPVETVARDPNRPLQLLFVGRINQRKGIKYLLEALRLVGSERVELTVCGRVVDDLALFRPFGDRVRVRPDVSATELADAYRSADLFVFPSVAEGFGQVLLESLASGLPILATTHTAAPDLIEDGREGFVVEPRQPTEIAERIEWALANRGQLAAMRAEARRLAESFTWERFRASVVQALSCDAKSGGKSEGNMHAL